MDLKFEPHEVRQDGRGTRLRFDWGGLLAGFRANDGKAVDIEMKRSVTDLCGARSVYEDYQWLLDSKAGMQTGCLCLTYGTILGPTEGNF